MQEQQIITTPLIMAGPSRARARAKGALGSALSLTLTLTLGAAAAAAAAAGPGPSFSPTILSRLLSPLGAPPSIPRDGWGHGVVNTEAALASSQGGWVKCMGCIEWGGVGCIGGPHREGCVLHGAWRARQRWDGWVAWGWGAWRGH